jgi:transposase
VQSDTHAEQQRKGLRARLLQAEKQLAALNKRPGDDRDKLVERALAVVKQHHAADYLHVTVTEVSEQRQRFNGPGRPGPARTKHTLNTTRLVVECEREQAAIAVFEQLAGYRQYATNAPNKRLSLLDGVQCYRQQWQPERAFHRLKNGLIPIAPLYLQTDDRIAGLVLLLTIALRVLTLIEFVVRRELSKNEEVLKGLYSGNAGRATATPTTERLLDAFEPVTLYRYQTPQGSSYQVSKLSALQTRILQLLGISPSIYDPVAVAQYDSG